jgi:fatty acid desaturase
MSLSHIQQVNGLVPRRRLRQLMARTDLPAWLFLGRHLGFLALTGWLVSLAVGTTWLVPAMMMYGLGIVHLFAAQHECAHRTAFRTRALNDIVGWVIGAFILLPHVYFRWEHTDHHTFTQQGGRDPQLIAQPRSLAAYLLYLSTLPYWWGFLRPFARHLVGIIEPGERRFIPASECWKVIWEARVMFALYVGAAAVSVALHTRVLLLFWLLPRVLAEPFMRFVRMTEHVGRPVDEPDLLESSRTCLVAPPLRWLAWNMPYHAEHHLSPAVPFHALPALHEQLRGRQRVITRGYWAAHKEILSRIGELRSRASERSGTA